jgi:uncharacterized Fe-S cluster-containing protein
MGRKPLKKKDKFADLADDFKDKVLQSSAEEIRNLMGAVALLEVTDKEMLKNDPEVASAREALKFLMEPYRENLKQYRLKQAWCKLTLDAKDGGATTAKAEEERDRNREAGASLKS